MIVGLAGKAGSGKTTAADYLVKQHSYVRRKFADPLKNMLRAVGLTEREIEGEGKHQPCPLLCGKTPRWGMQSLGTEWGRELIHPDLWTTLWANFDRFTNVVADDVRFPNEAQKIRELGGIVIRIERPDALPLDYTKVTKSPWWRYRLMAKWQRQKQVHASEQIKLEADFTVINNASIEHLCNEVWRLILTNPMKVT